MIADLKPYSEYKESGLPWLGQVPEHWEVKRLGALLCERGEKNDQGQVTDVLSLLRERGVIPYGEKGRVGNKKSEDITRYKVVCSDDIVVNCMNVIIGSVGLSRYTGCLSPVYYVLTKRFEEDNPRYLNAYFQTKPFQESLVRIGNGILSHRMRIPMELLKCELFPRPPADEQAAIVRFLDHATRRLERAILAKRKVIAGRAEEGHHPPRRHPRPRPFSPPKTLWHPLARGYSAALGTVARQSFRPCWQWFYAVARSADFLEWRQLSVAQQLPDQSRAH
jgi:type I restriction enzyme S subunit